MRQALGRMADNLWLVILAMSALVFGAQAVLTWTPSPHAVHTPGAITVAARSVAQVRPPYVYLDLAPGMSLAAIRCEAWHWQNRDLQCPGPAVLGQFWPNVTQSPKTLYFGLWGCAGSDLSGHIEYVSSNRQLIAHCIIAAPWFRYPGGAQGSNALLLTDLILVPTDAIGQGQVSVIRDDRVEHLIGDVSTQTLLGKVVIRG